MLRLQFPTVFRCALPTNANIPGAQSILAAFTRNDFPEDAEQIFLTSWGEWWPKENFQLSLDKELQNKWSVSKEVIEREEMVD